MRADAGGRRAGRRTALAQEEIFGPVQVVIPFDGEAEALRIANGTAYGLVAGVWTRDGGRALRMARELKCGQVFVNNYGAGGGIELPFGGVKALGPRPREGLRGAVRLLDAEDRGHPPRLKADMSMRLKDKVAIVTGGGSGFGEGIVRKFVAEGAQGAGRRPQPRRRRSAWRRPGRRTPPRTAPTSAATTTSLAMIDAAEARFGALDILVNNAGVGHVPHADWRT